MPSYFYVQRYVENGFLIYLLVEIRLRVFSLVLVLTGVCQGGGINNNLVDSLPFKDSPRNRGGASGAATGASGSLNFSWPTAHTTYSCSEIRCILHSAPHEDHEYVGINDL